MLAQRRGASLGCVGTAAVVPQAMLPGMTSDTARHRSLAQQAELDAELTALIEHRITFNQVLGLKVQALRPNLALRFDMRPELVGHYHYGRLHGGVISAALDALGGVALMVGLADKHAAETPEQVMHRFLKLGTIDLRVDFLRPGLGRHFVATAEVTRLGGRVGSTQMRLLNDEGTLIATAAVAQNAADLAFQKYDADQDGKVTPAELPQESVFKRFDLNSDGTAAAPAEVDVNVSVESLEEAVKMVKGGDLVAVMPGHYAGFTLEDKLDTGDERFIHWKALGKPGEVVIDRPTAFDPKWMIVLSAVHHVIVEGFALAGESDPKKPRWGPRRGSSSPAISRGRASSPTTSPSSATSLITTSAGACTAPTATRCCCKTTSLPSRRWSTGPTSPTARTTT